MKIRLWALIVVVALVLTGCSTVVEQPDEPEQIYASFYPIYALSSLMLDGISGIRLKCLVQPQDDCLRLYDLSDWDASVLAYDADAVIIGGNGLESFESALYTFGDDGPAIITATHALTLFNQDGDSGIDGTTGHLADANPHLYMSVPGSRKMIAVISEALQELYPDLAEDIGKGMEAADSQLENLAAEMDEICADCRGGKVILMNEALIYTALDLGLTVEYRYDRESGTTLYGDSLEEAISEFNECGASVILIEKQAPEELTTALEAAGFKVALIDIMSSYSTDAGSSDYIDVQLANAKAIAEAFN